MTPTVVFGCHHTNTPGLVNDQLTAVLAGRAIGIVTKAVLRTGSGDR